MKEKIEALRIEIQTAMDNTQTSRALYELKMKFQAELIQQTTGYSGLLVCKILWCILLL